MKQIYKAFMVFEDGVISPYMFLDKAILFEENDPIINTCARHLSKTEDGLLIVFGLRNIAVFEYRQGKLRKMHPLYKKK